MFGTEVSESCRQIRPYLLEGFSGAAGRGKYQKVQYSSLLVLVVDYRFFVKSIIFKLRTYMKC
jgi:hypothetical protein